MKSLRAQLLVGLALCTTAVLVVCGGLLYALISSTLRAEFDEALAAKARSLAALAEQDEDGLGFEPPEASLPEYAASQRAEYYQLWRSDGSIYARSSSLVGRDLDRPAGTTETPVFAAVKLPDGRAGRTVGMTFVPRQEYEGGRAEPPMTVMLAVAREIDALQSTLSRVRLILLGVCLVAVVLSTGLLAWSVRRSIRPINRLGGQIAEVGEGDLSIRIGSSEVPLELLPVVDRLNDLLTRLDAAFQRERRFTGDVAHELRTPLAGLRAKLELALSRDRTPIAYRKSMDDCLQINLQMQRMIENLLHLARADAGQLEVRRELVGLLELVQECWRPLEAKAELRGLSVEWRLNIPDTVQADRDKLRLVIQNVLDNAVTYAEEGGRVRVSTQAVDGQVELVVSNTGGTVSSDKVQHVFDRFWRGDSAFGRPDEVHCGLGLPLCKAIVEQLRGSIAATTEPEGIFAITLRLPTSHADAKVP